MNTSSDNSSLPMSSRPLITQEWSVHAELTFSHDQLASSAPVRQPSCDSGMQTTCSWGSQTTPSNSLLIQPSLHPCYGFQRGSILFTTTPPARISHQSTSNEVLSFLQSSNNSSEHASVHRATPGHSPQPYNRRCKSTCSIILSGVHEPPETNHSTNRERENTVNRGTSCSPTPKCYHTLTHRCGDPVCYHANCVSRSLFDKPTSTSIPAPSSTNEPCEVCGGGRSPTAMRRAARANTFTTHFCTHVPERAHSFGGSDSKHTLHYVKESKDAAIQTTDMPVRTESVKSRDKKAIKTKTNNYLLVPDQDAKGNSPERRKSSKKLSRSPARLRGKSPLMQSRRNSVSDSRSSTPENNHHKHRTVHIDVYCTGSEDADASTSDTTEDMESFSSPQTVFESEKLRVVQKHAGKNELPLALQPHSIKPDIVIRSDSLMSASKEMLPLQPLQPFRFDSDDGLSSLYPSNQSSYSNFPDSEASLFSDVQTSRDPSSSTISTSSCAVLNDYDSVAATSWKDTVTEIESLDQSNISLAQSDSFEYADAMDRLRIREKEKAWACSAEQTLNDSNECVNEQIKTWQSPSTERKHLVQQQKFQEYLEKHHGAGFPLWKPDTTEDSEEEDDDETGDAWIFSATAEGLRSQKYNTIKREGTIKKASGGLPTELPDVNTDPMTFDKSSLPGDSGSLSDSGTSVKHRFVRRDVIGPFGIKSPSPPPSKLESMVTSPFTAIGNVTNQLFKAQKFGTIVGAFRKPGHHVGPARNPDCTCEHCREYYETIGHRGRARSVGDVPYASRSNWKM